MPTPNKDAGHLDRLRDYYADHRHIPSFQRVAELMGFASKAASAKLLDRLADAGFVERTPDDDAWIPTKTFFARPLAETAVRAGAPDMIEAGAGEPFLVDEFLVRTPSKTVMVPVRGDSMIDAGIQPGDMVLVERGASPRSNDIVIAQVDGEWTMKYFIREKKFDAGTIVPKID